MKPKLPRCCPTVLGTRLKRDDAEELATAFKAIADPGRLRLLSFIAAQPGAVATGAALVALILTFGPISGAHFNPAVTLADASQGGVSWRDARGYVVVQVVGALVGVAIADVMFGEPVFALSRHVRHGPGQMVSEFVATFGLLATIWSCSRLRSATVVPFAVAAYFTSAYRFTASTSFANPAVTVAR